MGEEMYCKKCGYELHEEADVCLGCGSFTKTPSNRNKNQRFIIHRFMFALIFLTGIMFMFLSIYLAHIDYLERINVWSFRVHRLSSTLASFSLFIALIIAIIMLIKSIKLYSNRSLSLEDLLLAIVFVYGSLVLYFSSLWV